jgi:hypothetical protein
MGLNARTWNAFCVSAYLMFPAIVGVWFLRDDSLLIWPLLLVILWGVLVAILGAIQGVLLSCGKLHYGCPVCNEKSLVTGGGRDGIYIDCPKCGELRLRLGRLSGLKIIRPGTDEDDMADFYENPGSPLTAAKRYPVAFCIIFSPVVFSIIFALLIHEFSFSFILILLISYALGGVLLDAIYSGKMSDNHGTAHRKRNPIRFWGKVGIWSFAYLFVTAFPIGFALQESKKERESLMHADEISPLLSKIELEQLGFQSKALRSVPQSDWDRQHFGPADMVEQEIRSLKPMKDDPSLFPRFTIIREIYGSQGLAEQRWRRLRDHDPELDSKIHSGLVLRDGFVRGKNVWIVTTDAVIFSHQELDKIMRNIQNLIL